MRTLPRKPNLWLWPVLLFMSSWAQQAQGQTSLAEPCEVRDPLLQGRYEGGCLKGRAHGVGKVTPVVPGQGSYEGEFRFGFIHGQGRFSYPNGDVYEGQWVDGLRNGGGRLIFGPGSSWYGDRYEGQWKDDQQHGYGRYTWVFGDVYEGAWRAGQITGEATSAMVHRERLLKKLAPRLKEALASNQLVCSTLTPGSSPSFMLKAKLLEVRDDRVRVSIRQEQREPQWEYAEPRWEPMYYWLPCATKAVSKPDRQ
ncbi:MAG: hypothetical protein RLZZ271_1325 [Pseudomonadota bacterium]|jgi:hypothetical protein